MAQSTDIAAIFEAAIQNEEEAYDFYSEVAQRATNPVVRQTFAELAGDELGHKVFLQGCLKDSCMLRDFPVGPDYKVAEATPLPDLSIELKPADALALAMKKEEMAARGYEALAKDAPDADQRKVFENLAKMEIGHKTRLETLFVDIGYPEAF
ncbi:MAG: ferritin family protein [Thermoleophilia bacterium]|nr:ferritin family protein [Thermoleophilia bacterium]